MKELTKSTDTLSASFPFLKTWLGYQQKHLKLPGLVVAIAKDGDLVFKEAYGFSNLEKKSAMAPDQLFRIASHSKTFATVAILQLCDAGKIDLEDHIAKFLPWLKGHSDQRVAKITVRNLLSNSSGLLRDVQDVDYWQLERPFLDESALQETVMKAPLFADPATELKYSNTGFSLVGLIVEKVTGVEFNEYVKEKILQPLNLKNTGPEFDKAIVKRLATGYSAADFADKRIPFGQVDTRAMSAATGFYSCADDLLKFFTALSSNSNSPISAKLKREMQQTHWRSQNITDKREYGLGLQIEYGGDRRYFGHGGAFPGQRSFTLCDIERRLVVTALANAIDFEPLPFVKGIYSAIDFFEADSPPEAKLRQFEGIFRNLWGSTQLVARGKSLVAIDPDTTSPFKDAESLEYVDKYLLKVTKCGGYGNNGEFVRFNFKKDNTVESLTYGGATMLPQSQYLKKYRRSKSIAQSP
jgi:CubicO group peptidase (beta-lactamase class C family)